MASGPDAPKSLALLVVSAMLLMSPGCGESPSEPTALAVSSVQPGAAPGGAEVRLYGAGFKPGATVSMAGKPATVLQMFDSQIVVLTPDHPAGNKVDVIVTNPDMRAVTLVGGFTYQSFEITSIARNAGYPGLRFLVFGTGFMTGARLAVDGVNALAGSFSATSMPGVAPPHAIGPADVTVTNPGGRSVTVRGGFEYLPLPVLAATPTVVAPGGQITVTWTVSIQSGFDWVALYKLGTDNFAYLSWKYIQGLTGTTTFTAPNQPGQYESACTLIRCGSEKRPLVR